MPSAFAVAGVARRFARFARRTDTRSSRRAGLTGFASIVIGTVLMSDVEMGLWEYFGFIASAAGTALVALSIE